MQTCNEEHAGKSCPEPGRPRLEPVTWNLELCKLLSTFPPPNASFCVIKMIEPRPLVVKVNHVLN